MTKTSSGSALTLYKTEKMQKNCKKIKNFLKTIGNPCIMLNAVTLIAVMLEVAVIR
jgi:ferredoxin-fold anticodon binding domain-containing protein